MLQIEHLTKTYGEKKAVDDLSLHILPGEIYGFIGHNGAGKTTTLKSVAGILRFDAGEIRIGGTSIRTDPLACKRKLAYIPDNPDLYDYMTGIQYLNFIANIFGVSAADRQARIRELAERFELTNDLAQPIAAYSHGMKQKLSILHAPEHFGQAQLLFPISPVKFRLFRLRRALKVCKHIVPAAGIAAADRRAQELTAALGVGLDHITQYAGALILRI